MLIFLHRFLFFLLSNKSITVAAQCKNDNAGCLDLMYLEEVLVTGTRTAKTLLYSPNTTVLIDEQIMQRQTSHSLAEAVRDIPGVNIVDAGHSGMKRISIRGGQSYRVAILIDGQQISDHRGEGVPLTLNPAIVERIEMIKGSGSVLYGARSLFYIWSQRTISIDASAF